LTLLAMVSTAMVRQGQTAPPTVIGNPDTGVVQRVALLQDIGDELAERVSWQRLNIAATIAGDGSTKLFPLPDDWGGMSEGEQLQSSAYPLLPVVGPLNNEAMAAFKAFPVAPLQPIWRIIQNQFEFFPAPADTEIYTYNYYSNLWIASATGTPQPAWLADTDVSLIDEKLMTTGLEWRWLKSKGLDYSEEFRRYELRLTRAEGRDDDSREVNMARKRLPYEGTWPGVLPIYGWPP
jgi:hypothetical protein